MRVLSRALFVLLLTASFSAPGIAGRASGPSPHAAITITSDADFLSCGCVTGGSGTAAKPYVIGPWLISAPSAGGWALKVDNSKGTITKFFNVAGITANYNDLDPSHNLVWLIKVTKQTTVANITANADGTGVRLDSVSNISLDAISLNKLVGDAVLVNSSSYVSIVNSKLKSDMSGLRAENSSHIQVGVGCKNTCNEFTYDEVRGIWFHNTHDSVITQTTTAAEDTTAIFLDGSGTYNDEVKNSTANSSSSICEPPSGHTGLVTDTDGGLVLVNGAHDNYLHDVSANGNYTDISGRGNGYWIDPCTFDRVPISPATPAMGSGNVFANLCYQITNIPNLPPKTCKN